MRDRKPFRRAEVPNYQEILSFVIIKKKKILDSNISLNSAGFLPLVAPYLIFSLFFSILLIVQNNKNQIKLSEGANPLTVSENWTERV